MQFEKEGLVDQAAPSAIDNEILFLAATIPQVRVTRHKTQQAFASLLLKCSKCSVAHTKAGKKKAE